MSGGSTPARSRPLDLAYWSRSLLDVELDFATGEADLVRRSAPRRADEPLRGYAAVERSFRGRPVAVAVFRRGPAIILRAGVREWNLGSPDVRLRHRRWIPFVSTFQVLEKGSRTWALHYWHIRRLARAVIDPTYDGIDESSDFFLQYLADHGTSAQWRQAALATWQDPQD